MIMHINQLCGGTLLSVSVVNVSTLPVRPAAYGLVRPTKGDAHNRCTDDNAGRLPNACAEQFSLRPSRSWLLVTEE